MERLERMKKLVFDNDSTILFWVFDGIGGLPHPETNKTELETAETPALDAFAQQSSCGGLVPFGPGVTPGSGPGHLSLFGYPLDEFELPRGVLEVLGADGAFNEGEWVGEVEPGPTDLTMRGNFASLDVVDGQEVVSDRRANRIATEENKRICEKLSRKLQIDGYDLYFHPGKEHRFALLIRGDGLAGGLTDSDPQKSGIPPETVEALQPEAREAARICNLVIERATELLSDEPEAHTTLLRGIGCAPDIPTLEELYGIKTAAIATYPMYRGIARLLGMDILEVGSMKHEDEVATLERHFDDYDFFYLHIKETDSVAHKGAFDEKVEIFESVDPHFERALELDFDVVALTGDHCTPCVLGDHSWHPIPTALWSETVLDGGVESFDERQVRKGTLGTIESRDLMPLALAEAGRFNKYGA